ncbi:4,5:9,10-diseco-3-hydroxy-5,9,17-trioxoandrosta-1(10),2-diene-4-oate hydrolase [Linum grandiflorum]
MGLASLYTLYLRRCFSGAGLSEQTIDTDSTTTIKFWGPSSHNIEKPTLVLIHGFGPVAVWQWGRQVQSFAPHYNLYLPDLVFFGESYTTSSRRSEVFQAETVAALLENVGVKRYSVVGTSYGGFVAYHMARMWAERVDKVVIASSGVNMRHKDNEELVKRGKVETISDLMLPQTPTQLRALLDVAANRNLRLVPAFILRDFVHKLYADKRNEKLELLKGLTLGQDDSVNLSPLRQDVLLIWGEEDKIFPVRMSHELKGLTGEKNVKLEIMKKASHVPQIEYPTKFNAIVKTFLSS